MRISLLKTFSCTEMLCEEEVPFSADSLATNGGMASSPPAAMSFELTDLIIKSQLKDPDVRALFADPEYSDMIAGLYHEFAEGAQRAGMEAVLRQEGVISMLQRFDILRTPMNEEVVVDMLNDARLRTIARARFDECLLRLAHLRARTGGDDVKAFITAVEGVGVSSGAAILEQLLREMQSRNMPLARDPALGGGAKTIYPNRPFHRHGQVASVTDDPLSRSGGGGSSSGHERKGARGAPSRRVGAAAVTERLASRPALKLEPPPGGSPGVDRLTFEQLRRHVSALEQQLASADDRLRSAGLVPTRRAASTKLDGSMLVVDIEKHGQHARHVIDVTPAGMTTASEHESTLAHFVEMRAKIAALGARNVALEMARGAAEAEPKASSASSSKASSASSKSASPPRALSSALTPRDANALAELQAELKRVRERERDFCHQLKAKTKECEELERLLRDANALVAAVRQQRGSSALEHAKRLLHSDGRGGAPPPNSLGAQAGAQSLALNRGSSAATLDEGAITMRAQSGRNLDEGATAVELKGRLAACLKENEHLRAQIAQLELLAGMRRGGVSEVGLLEYAENMKVRPLADASGGVSGGGGGSGGGGVSGGGGGRGGGGGGGGSSSGSCGGGPAGSAPACGGAAATGAGASAKPLHAYAHHGAAATGAAASAKPIGQHQVAHTAWCDSVLAFSSQRDGEGFGARG